MYNNILDLLCEQYEKKPNNIAFSDEIREITFEELHVFSRAIGSVLSQKIQMAEPVVLYMEKSVVAVCGLLGIVCAGGCYSFLDVKMPEDRANKIITTLQTNVVLTDANNIDALNLLLEGKENIAVIRIDELYEALSIKKQQNIQQVAEMIDEKVLREKRKLFIDTNPLYINFTSGSTGMPKGVAVSHRAVLDFIGQFVSVFGINETDVIANQAPFDFDVSVKDIYSGLYSGAKVCLVPKKYFSRPIELMDYLIEIKPTVLIWAVSALCILSVMKCFEYKVPKELRYVMFSGEVMPIKHYRYLKSYLKETSFVNLYGPTEVTCNCTYYVIKDEYNEGDVIPIGKPFPNEKVFLLDGENKLILEPGSMGEICVAGTTLALGYYGNEEKTSEAFVQNPLNNCFREIIYRTGDIGKYDADGDLVYVTRKDFQVKHMGHRIELGEIESCALMIDEVSQACCEYDGDNKRIVLFYCGEVTEKIICTLLRKKLPTYMIPRKLLRIDSMPLNKNGKIDRKYLMDHYYRIKDEENAD